MPLDRGGTIPRRGRGEGIAGDIAEGAIVSLELDLDKGTLRFWLDGKPHGPGWSSGVKINGKLRWAVIAENEGTSVEIMPTPELEPWKE